MATDISLTAGMRNNLLSLQQTTNLQGQTYKRLASGKKVNSALDNPTNYFAAKTHNNRAADLTSRKDGMSETVQMVKAADTGITAITGLIEAARGVTQAALATTSTVDRNNYAATFSTLLGQITGLAGDSGYRGTNLLNGATQTVEFAPTTNAATLQIKGFSATSIGLGLESTKTTNVSNNIAAGFGYSLAINTDGTVSAWGDLANPGAVVPAGLTNVVSVKSGPDFSLALKGDGTVVAWGNNSNGQVSGANGLTGVTAISAGIDFTFAVKSDGTVAAWGNNHGSSNVVSSATALTGVVAISAGTSYDTGVALKSDGSIVSWGNDGFGIVTGTTSALNPPAVISPPTGTGYTAIANGGYQAVAIKADTSVVVWGTDDAYGQKSDMPVGLTGVTAVAAGKDFTIALKSDGTVVGWGAGITRNGTSLAIPAGLTGVVAISAGENYAIALKGDGTVVGWGTGAASGTIATQSGKSAGGWSADTTIKSVATQLEGALTTLRNQSANLSASLSVVTTRQNFTDEMVNTLNTGADNLTLADMNNEGANMLMLQTRQSLGTTSLSMASQAAQAVLKLF